MGWCYCHLLAKFKAHFYNDFYATISDMNAFITTFRTEFCQAARISYSRLIRPKGHSDVYPIISKTGLCYPSFLLWSRISYFVYSLTDWARKFMVVIYSKEYHLQKNWKDLIRHPTIVLLSNRSWSWDWLNSCWRWTDPRNRKWHQHTNNDGGISTLSFHQVIIVFSSENYYILLKPDMSTEYEGFSDILT